MAILVPRKKEFWLRKPTGKVELSNHYSEDNFTNAYIFQPQGTLPLTRNDILSETGISYNSEGMHVSGVAGDILLLDAPVDLSTNEGTLITRVKRGFPTGYAEGIFADKDNINFLTTGLSLNVTASGGIHLNLGAHTQTSSSTDLFGDFEYHNIVALYSGGNTSRIFVDGVEILYDTQGVTTTNIPASSLNARLGAYYSNSGIYLSKTSMPYFYSFNRRMGTEEAFAISEAPYQILKPRKKWFFLGTNAQTINLPPAQTTSSSKPFSPAKLSVLTPSTETSLSIQQIAARRFPLSPSAENSIASKMINGSMDWATAIKTLSIIRKP